MTFHLVPSSCACWAETAVKQSWPGLCRRTPEILSVSAKLERLQACVCTGEVSKKYKHFGLNLKLVGSISYYTSCIVFVFPDRLINRNPYALH